MTDDIYTLQWKRLQIACYDWEINDAGTEAIAGVAHLQNESDKQAISPAISQERAIAALAGNGIPANCIHFDEVTQKIRVTGEKAVQQIRSAMATYPDVARKYAAVAGTESPSTSWGR